ncbi:MAG: GDSL family lipase [Bacteroidales bacterium]|nr:GDSL family lipase [Bacteroidales bacterium]
MKRIIALFVLAAVACTAAAREKVPATDSRITFVGRTSVTEGTVSFDWSGVYARIAFTGGYLALEAGDTGKDYFNVWIDRDPSAEPDRVVIIDRDTTLVLFQKKERKPLPHRIVIQKRTEGEQGRAVFRAFEAEGQFLQAEETKERLIEVVGDSYTCGYGSENSVREDPFRPEDENPAKTYADILGRYFGADILRVAHSGMGIDRNYNDAVRGWHMPQRYLQTFDLAKEPAWEFTGARPSITIIYLGTNDFSTGRQPGFQEFKAGYVRLLQSIKSHYGEGHPILCVAPKHSPEHHEYIRRVVESCGLPAVYFAGLPEQVHDNDADLGASWHPNYTGHLKKAYSLIPVVSTLTGWPMENKTVE